MEEIEGVSLFVMGLITLTIDISHKSVVGGRGERPRNSSPLFPLIESPIEINAYLAIKDSNPQADTAMLESQIDTLVYTLYGLSDEEIKIIENKE